MKTLSPLLSLLALAGCANPVATPPVERMAVRSITVFGDSMSDVGTYAAATGDADNPGKFTVNPGKVWVEEVAAAHGLGLTPQRALTLDKDASMGATDRAGTATVLGGNAYAEGGARIALRPSQSGIGNNALVAPVKEQVSAWAAQHGRFAPGSLVLIGGGGNDSYAQFSALCWGTPGATDLKQAQGAMDQAAREQLQLVRTLHESGAGLILVTAATDWSRNPFAQKYLAPEYQAQNCRTPVNAQTLRAWSRGFNQILQDGLRALPGVLWLDPAEVFADMMARPAAYGLVNFVDVACTNTTPTGSATFCTRQTLAAPDADETWFWADNFHPTPRAHRALAERALELLRPHTVQAPGRGGEMVNIKKYLISQKKKHLK